MGFSAAWDNSALVLCADGKYRRVSTQPCDEPLAARLPRSVGPSSARLERVGLVAAKANRTIRLKAYGNALTVPTAAAFVRAYMEIVQ